ncbi:MAG: aminoglycoside phosphotransferase, partial [Achromobacter sp.]
MARMVMVVAIGGWRAARYPENADYILRNNAISWQRLAACDAVPRATAQRVLRAACNLS